MEGTHLKNFRRNKGLSLRAFGKQVNLSGERVRQLENYNHISPEIQERICAAFSVDSADPLFTTPHTPQVKNPQAAKKKPQAAEKARKKAEISRKKEEMAAERVARATYLRNLRMELGVSQNELAAAIGVRQNQLSAWECGRHCISDDSMERIEKAVPAICEQREQDRVSRAQRERDWVETEEPFIAICKSGLLLSKAVVEKIGGRVKVYYTEASRQMAIMAAKEDEMGAPILYIDGNCKLNNTDVRKVAEKLLGFKVRNGYCRVRETWTLDDEYEYWKFDFSACQPNT